MVRCMWNLLWRFCKNLMWLVYFSISISYQMARWAMYRTLYALRRGC